MWKWFIFHKELKCMWDEQELVLLMIVTLFCESSICQICLMCICLWACIHGKVLRWKVRTDTLASKITSSEHHWPEKSCTYFNCIIYLKAGIYMHKPHQSQFYKCNSRCLLLSLCNSSANSCGTRMTKASSPFCFIANQLFNHHQLKICSFSWSCQNSVARTA